MRSATRLFAVVSRSSQYLEPGAPTGLAGLATHGSPRTALLYLYNSTLEKLKQFPEHSVYRQSTEALTKHRLSIIESAKPAGLEEWQTRVQPVLEQYPKAFKKINLSSGSGYNIVWRQGVAPADPDAKKKKIDLPQVNLGPYESEEEQAAAKKVIDREIRKMQTVTPEIEAEPALTVEQIGEIETKINAGLIEEIIEVAEGENILASTLLESKVWEDLEEKPVEGQWAYHKQDRGTAGTPPKN